MGECGRSLRTSPLHTTTSCSSYGLYGAALLAEHLRLELLAGVIGGLVEPDAHLRKRRDLAKRSFVDVNPLLAGHAVRADLDDRVAAFQLDLLDPGRVVDVMGEDLDDLDQGIPCGSGLVLEVRRRVQLFAVEQIEGDHTPAPLRRSCGGLSI